MLNNNQFENSVAQTLNFGCSKIKFFLLVRILLETEVALSTLLSVG
jgi:hypothetical protein